MELNAMTAQQIHARLSADGYRQGPPPWSAGALVDGAGVDLAVAADSDCPHCGHHGLTYVAYHIARRALPVADEATRSYRAFAVCPQCGLGDEF